VSVLSSTTLILAIGTAAWAVVMLTMIHLARRLAACRELLVETETHAMDERQGLQVALDHMRQGIVILDQDNKVAMLNSSALRLLGLARGSRAPSMPGTRVADVLCKTVDETLRHLATAGSPRFEMRSPAGAAALDTEVTNLPGGRRLITFTDISRERRAEAQIRHLASHDVLTGVASRPVFIRTLDEIIATRPTAGDAALLVIDLDGFSRINDAHGHAFGDAALQAVARRLRRLVRHDGVVGRLGSDAFGVIQRHILASADVNALARRLCEEIARPLEISGVEIVIRASIGIAIVDSAEATAQSLLMGAGLALDEARASGGARFAVHTRAGHAALSADQAA